LYLARLTIEGFRRIDHLELEFRPGLNVLVGPNNVGKTAIIDALRALLATANDGTVRVDEHDIHRDASGQRASEIVFHYVFAGLTEPEEADFLLALKPVADESSTYEAHLSVRYSDVDDGGRLRAKRWCGDHEENAMTADMLEALSAVYLPPLRDPASGLRPSRNSQLARLAVRLSDESARSTLVETLKAFDQALSKAAPVANTQTAVSARHEEMLGSALCQALTIGLSQPDFQRLAARLSLVVESLDVEQNGLGYNNLIFMAVVLSELSTNPRSAYRALIVEEPEAHLHPQLQVVLLDYLQAKQEVGPEQPKVQVFVTSHSPHFASGAHIDAIGCIHHGPDRVRAFFPRTVAFDKTKKEKLQRYLDVTRAALFFAKRIVLVEGASELFMINVLASRLGIDLRKNSVSVLSTEGLNFDAFIPLFGEGRLSVRVAVLSDRDPGDVYPLLGEEPNMSDAAKNIAGHENAFIKPFFALKTFEYDLALQPANREPMISALEQLHPLIGQELRLVVAGAQEDAKARELFSGMFERGKGRTAVQKGAFAQALAHSLNGSNVGFVVPPYIKSALEFVTEA
jgi:putative ATP-dependent endonuclease of OLD family